MARSKKKINTVKYKRESTKRSNAEVAKDVLAGKYGTENLERTIYQLGYNAKAVMILVKAYGNIK